MLRWLTAEIDRSIALHQRIIPDIPLYFVNRRELGLSIIFICVFNRNRQLIFEYPLLNP